MDNTDKALLAIAFGLTALLSFILGHETGQNGVRKEALLIGHAQYIADSDVLSMTDQESLLTYTAPTSLVTENE